MATDTKPSPELDAEEPTRDTPGMGVVLTHDEWPDWCFTIGMTDEGDAVSFSMAPRDGWRFDRDERKQQLEASRGWIHLVAASDSSVLDVPQFPSRSPWSYVKQTFPVRSQPITARLLRRVPIGELMEYASSQWREIVEANVEVLEQEIQHLGDNAPAEYQERLRGWVSSLDRRPGRRGRPDQAYASLAALYVEKLGTTHAPVAELADKLGYSRSQVANLLYEARRRELLSWPPKGRAGGVLTPKGLQVLEDAQDSEGTS